MNDVLVYLKDQKNVVSYKVEDVTPWEKMPNVAINPEMKHFRGISRHYLKIENHQVLEIPEVEKKESDAFHGLNTFQMPEIITVEKIIEVPTVKVEYRNVIKEVPVEVETKIFPKTNFAVGSALGALVQYLIQKYLGG